MGANMTAKAITRAARSVSILDKLCNAFDAETRVPTQTTKHSTIDDSDDVKIVSSLLIKEQILSIIPGRCHAHFPKCKLNPLPTLKKDKIEAWIEKKKKQIVSLSIASGEQILSGEGDLSDEDATDDESENEN